MKRRREVVWHSLAVLALMAFGGVAGAADLPTFTVQINDGIFTPPALEVPAGQRIKIIVRNVGKGPTEFESTALRVEKVIGPGVDSFVVIHAMRPGTYEFFDEFHMDKPRWKLTAK